MKKLLTVILVVTMVLGMVGVTSAEMHLGAELDENGKYTTTPEMFRTNLQEVVRVNGVPLEQAGRDDVRAVRTYVRKQYLKTSNPEVDAAVAKMVDRMDEAMSGNLQEDPKPSSRYKTGLEIELIRRISGNTISVMIIGTERYSSKSIAVQYDTGVFDLETGEEVRLMDLFPADSAAWGIIGEEVRMQLGTMFPNEPRNTEVCNYLSGQVILEASSFMLSAGEITLHYRADEIYPGKDMNLLTVRIPYRKLEGLWTETGITATDNSKWKMVALTFDDGPIIRDAKKGCSYLALLAINQTGWKVTYYIYGKNIMGTPSVLIAESNAGHSIQNHSMRHPSGSEVGKWGEGTVAKQIYNLDDDMLEVIGIKTTNFRAPGGSYSNWIKKNVGLPIIQWSLDTHDSGGASAAGMVKKIRNEVQDGDIVLMHDTRPQTLVAIPEIATVLEELGFMPATVDELASIYGVRLEPNTVYWRITPNGATDDVER